MHIQYNRMQKQCFVISQQKLFVDFCSKTSFKKTYKTYFSELPNQIYESIQRPRGQGVTKRSVCFLSSLKNVFYCFFFFFIMMFLNKKIIFLLLFFVKLLCVVVCVVQLIKTRIARNCYTEGITPQTIQDYRKRRIP